jgi:hypothetical protein
VFYDFAITVAPTDTATSPKKEVLQLERGIIHRVEVQFPIGTRATVHCQVKRALHQVWPKNPQGDFSSDGYTIAWDDFYPLETVPYQLEAVLWSTADTYSYDIVLRFGILPRELLTPLGGVAGALKRFLKMVGVGG